MTQLVLTDKHHDYTADLCGADPRDPRYASSDAADANQSVDPNAAQPNQSADPNAGQPNQSVDPNAGQPNQSVDPNAAQPNQSVDPNAAQPNQSAGPNAGQPNQSADPNAGQPNQSVDPNAGQPNQSVDPNAAQPNQSVDPNAGQPNQSADPNAAQPNQSVDPNAGRPNRSVDPNAGQPNQSVDPNAGQPNQSVDPNAGQPNQSVDPNAGQPNQSVDPNAGQPNQSVDPNAGQPNQSVDPNAGQPNQSVDPNAGQPNQSVNLVSAIQPPASGSQPATNPYAGSANAGIWKQGFDDGFAQPDDAHPAPSPYTPDSQTIYAEGVLAGQQSARSQAPNQSVDPNAGKPPATTPDVPAPAPVDNSTGARFLIMFGKVGNRLGPGIGDKLKQLNTAELVGFAAVFIAIEDTPLGWAGIVAGAAMIGKEILAVIDDISECISITVNPNGDLDDAASHMVNALSRIAIDVLIAWLTHKASGAVKPYIKPPTGAVDVLTPEGLIIRVPADKIPDNASASEGSGAGEERGGREAISNPNKANLDKWMNVLRIDQRYRQAFGEFLESIHDGDIWDIIERPEAERTQDHPHLEDMSRQERARLRQHFMETYADGDE